MFWTSPKYIQTSKASLNLAFGTILLPLNSLNSSGATGNFMAFNALESSYDQSFCFSTCVKHQYIGAGCLSVNKREGDPIWYFCLVNLEFQWFC